MLPYKLNESYMEYVFLSLLIANARLDTLDSVKSQYDQSLISEGDSSMVSSQVPSQ